MLLLFLAFLMVNVAFLIVSLAAVYWDVTQRSPKEERCVISQKTAAKETRESNDHQIFHSMNSIKFKASLFAEHWT